MKQIFAVVFAILFFANCQSRVYCRYNIPANKLYDKQFNYLKKYGHISSVQDTTILDGQLQRHYIKGELKKIGKVSTKNGEPFGYWFEFWRGHQVHYIYRYADTKIDSFYLPFSIINESW